MKFLGRDPPESSLPASDRAPSEGEGETGGAGRIFSIFPGAVRAVSVSLVGRLLLFILSAGEMVVGRIPVLTGPGFLLEAWLGRTVTTGWASLCFFSSSSLC